MSLADEIVLPAPLTDEEQIALFTQVAQINEATTLIGKDVTNIAVMEPNLERLAATATLLSENGSPKAVRMRCSDERRSR